MTLYIFSLAAYYLLLAANTSYSNNHGTEMKFVTFGVVLAGLVPIANTAFALLLLFELLLTARIEQDVEAREQRRHDRYEALKKKYPYR